MVSEISTKFGTEFENIACPICFDTPHNAVLLKCSSYDKGCRAFMCDTNTSLSNCLDRYKRANGFSATAMVSIPLSFEGLTCPFCRGDVMGFIVVDNVRAYLNTKERCCGEMHCGYVSNYLELQRHAEQEHPERDRDRDRESFQPSSETTDIMSAIRSEVYRMIFGNYASDFEDESCDEFDDSSADECNWWTSSYQLS